jgi:uncharacterized protein YwlG (UPF0340 family)
MRGDHIYVERGLYTHHGIDCGDGSVIHYTGQSDFKVFIERTSIVDFAKGQRIGTVAYVGCDSPENVVKRAATCLGEAGYHLVFKNCEHFATFCKTGTTRSDQVAGRAAWVAGAVGTVAGSRFSVVAIGAMAAEGTAGAAAITSGLSAIGGFIGGGMSAGIALSALGPIGLGVGAAACTYTMVRRFARRQFREHVCAPVMSRIAEVGRPFATKLHSLDEIGRSRKRPCFARKTLR